MAVKALKENTKNFKEEKKIEKSVNVLKENYEKV